MLIPIQEIGPFSEFLLLYGFTDVHWLKKNIHNMIFEEKFHVQSNTTVKKNSED